MRKLAQKLKCEPSNVTGIVDRLEARGLVERRPDPADRRVKVAAATDEGRRVAGSCGRDCASRASRWRGCRGERDPAGSAAADAGVGRGRR